MQTLSLGRVLSAHGQGPRCHAHRLITLARPESQLKYFSPRAVCSPQRRLNLVRRLAASKPGTGGETGSSLDFLPARVISNTMEALQQHRLVLEVARELLEQYQHPGQYIQAKRHETDRAGFFAIASAPSDRKDDRAELELLLKASGPIAEELCGLKPGESVLISRPMGKGFQLDAVPSSQYPSVLLFATGSGISPIKALIESGALKGRKTIRLYYGTRTAEHMAFAGSIAAWSAKHGVTVIPVFSAAKLGYVQDILAQDEMVDFGDAAGTAAVLCGRKEMTREVAALLRSRGVDAILLNY